MREILFRGKKRDNGEWAYGDLCQVLPGCECKFNLIFSQEECATSSIVLPETVGQSTGMIDKNGRKIFEGDILKGKFKNYAVWFDNNEKAYVYGSSYQGGYIHSFATYLSGDFKPLEVIGNVHDNPELLEEVSNNA